MTTAIGEALHYALIRVILKSVVLLVLDLASVVRFLAHVSDPSSAAQATVATSAKSPLRRRLVWLAGFVVLTGLIFYLFPRPSLFPPLPTPNGYDILLQAAAKIMPSQKSVTELTATELSETVGRNKTALNELRHGLELPGTVPVRMGEAWLAAHGTNLIDLRAAAQALEAEARYLAQNGDATGAVNACLDLFRLSQAISRQGLLIDYLVAKACEAMAVRRMTNLLTTLPAAECQRAALAVEQWEGRREPFTDIVQRDEEWSAKSFGFFARLRLFLQDRAIRQSVATRYQTDSREVRRLALRLGSRAFTLERGRKPERAAELVPEFLRAVPLDPATQIPLDLP
jgi:hypothetical protein